MSVFVCEALSDSDIDDTDILCEVMRFCKMKQRGCGSDGPFFNERRLRFD